MTRIIPGHCPDRKFASPIFIFISSVRIWVARELSDLAEDARMVYWDMAVLSLLPWCRRLGSISQRIKTKNKSSSSRMFVL